MFLKSKNNKKGLVRSPPTPDNRMEVQTAPLRKGAEGPRVLLGRKDVRRNLACSNDHSGHLLLLRNSIAYFDYLLLNLDCT